jgi:N-acetylglutamate synthase-like GNAT family acetyltransferase
MPKTQEQIAISIVSNEERPEAVDFYRSCEYVGTISHTDTIIVARNWKNNIVGIGRVSIEEGVKVLRGMQIAPQYMRKGIGTKLLFALSDIINDSICYCLPHDWLVSFYAKVGFRRIRDDEAPVFLQKRLNYYRPTHPRLIAMKRGDLVKSKEDLSNLFVPITLNSQKAVKHLTEFSQQLERNKQMVKNMKQHAVKDINHAREVIEGLKPGTHAVKISGGVCLLPLEKKIKIPDDVVLYFSPISKFGFTFIYDKPADNFHEQIFDYKPGHLNMYDFTFKSGSIDISAEVKNILEETYEKLMHSGIQACVAISYVKDVSGHLDVKAIVEDGPCGPYADLVILIEKNLGKVLRI